ncbi:MAG: recombinase zinc ribbon domain-containing protein [Planctomycetota bacterium]
MLLDRFRFGCRSIPYQGVTRTNGKKRLDGTRVKTFYYGCGGYITKGRSICEMNAVPQKVLEETVIKMVLDFYRPLLGKGGRTKLAEAVKAQIGSEAEEFVAARKRAQRELNKISKTINNLLDNITSTNREFVDQRLGELKQQKHQLEVRLEELDRLSLSRDEINSMVSDSMKFLAGLEFVLREGVPQEKLIALRQCVEKISVDKPNGKITLAIYLVPVGNLQAIQESKASI